MAAIFSLYPMKPQPLILALFLAASCWTGLPSVFAQASEEMQEPQTLAPSTSLLISAAPFDVAVTWQPDDTLSVQPDWARLSGSLPFQNMKLPPRIRTSVEDDWLLGEFELQDGTWAALFSMPSADAGLPPHSLLPTSIASSTGNKTGQKVPAASVVSNPPADDPLAAGASDPTFPTKVTDKELKELINRKLEPGQRRFFVNNVSGDDASEGQMLHPQTGHLSKKGPFRNLATAIKKALAGDEIVLVGAGQPYRWMATDATSPNITITPVGDVTLEP